MKQHRHWAIFGSELSMKSTFIKTLLKGDAPEPFQDLAGKMGVLFSSITLNQFIKEEATHDDYTLSHDEHRSIRTFSSGEQKKALLNYLLAKDPDFIIMDNAFDMLDQKSQEQLLSRLKELSEKMTIIQVFRRKDNILPFISTVLHFQDDKLLCSETMEAFQRKLQESKTFSINGNIPPAAAEFGSISNPLVQFNNVSVKYGERSILNNICWEIKKGDFWQLMGPNGSGKTTLLTMVTGDNPKAYGQDLTLFGRKKGSGESIWEIKQKIGYVTPAMTTLFKGRHTVESMVISGFYDSIGLYKRPTYRETELADQWLDLIGLTDLRKTWFVDLPEEQQCLILIVRSMVKHPPLLILDEPTHGLDDYNVSVITALVNKIAEESQTTLVYVSHKKEKGLNPATTYELLPSDKGSEGRVLKHT